MHLQLRYTCAGTYFADAACSDCVLSETTSPSTHPRIILGRHGHAMMLTARHVRELLPHLQKFATTGRLTDDPAPDWQI